MHYRACDIRDLEPGRLGLIAMGGGDGTRPVLSLKWEQHASVLMLPSGAADARFDFRIRRVVGTGMKVVDLGQDFVFDFDLDKIIMRDEKIVENAGSLLITSTGLALVGLLGQEISTYDGEISRVSVQTGKFGITRRDHTCEVGSWRLLLPHSLPNEPAKQIASWPLAPAPAATNSSLRL